VERHRIEVRHRQRAILQSEMPNRMREPFRAVLAPSHALAPIALQKSTPPLAQAQTEAVVWKNTVWILTARRQPGREHLACRQAQSRVIDLAVRFPAEDLRRGVIERTQTDDVGIRPDSAPLVQQTIAKPVREESDRAGAAMMKQHLARQHFARIAQTRARR